MTIVASLSGFTRPRSQLILEVFPGKQVVLVPSLRFIPGLRSAVCSLRFTLTGYQPQPSALADNPYLDLDYSGCHKNFIQ